MRRIENLEASDDVKAYLRKVSRESHAIFRRGHISAPAAGVCTAASQPAVQPSQPQPTPISFVPRRLPMKKKRASSDSDNDESSIPPSAKSPPVVAPSEIHSETQMALQPSTSAAGPTRVNLAAKWFQLASFSPFALPSSALPETDFVSATVQRFLSVRERITQFRMGLELVHEHMGSGNYAEAVRAAHQYTGFTGPRTKKGAETFSALQRATVTSLEIPSGAANLRDWHHYLEGPHGPFAFQAPSTTLMAELDDAHANTVLHVVMTKLQRGSRKIGRPVEEARHNAHDDDASDSDVDVDSGLSGLPSESIVGKLFINDELDQEDEDRCGCEETKAIEPVPILDLTNCSEFFDDDVNDDKKRELLRFLRFLMPCGDASSTSPKSRGLGVWFYACAATVDVLVDPDTDRALHDLFRSVCQHIKTLSDALQSSVPGGDGRGALLAHLSGKGRVPFEKRNDVDVKSYWSLKDVDQHDLLALYTILVILAKVFRQNQNHFLTL